MPKITSSKDILMILLYAKGSGGKLCEPIRGRTRLVKMVFLFKKEIWGKLKFDEIIPKDALPEFEAYDFGPFSSQVYSDLEFLVNLGFVKVQGIDGSEILTEEALEYSYWQVTSNADESEMTEEKEQEFSLTNMGREFVEEKLKHQLSAEQWAYINEFKARCTSTPLRALLRYVYAKYPKTTTKSKIRDEIMSEWRY
jgi:uncharacterized protein YwgA